MEELQMFKPVSDSMVGGSLCGYVDASYGKLVALFGEPNSEGDMYKVSTQWVLEKDETGILVRLYDYKDTNLYDGSYPSVEEFRQLDTYKWHVGAQSTKEAALLIEFINSSPDLSSLIECKYCEKEVHSTKGVCTNCSKLYDSISKTSPKVLEKITRELSVAKLIQGR